MQAIATASQAPTNSEGPKPSTSTMVTHGEPIEGGLVILAPYSWPQATESQWGFIHLPDPVALNTTPTAVPTDPQANTLQQTPLGLAWLNHPTVALS